MDAHKHRILILGSGPSASKIDEIDRTGYYVIGLNNAWRAIKNPYELMMWHHSTDLHLLHPMPSRDLRDHLYVKTWGYATHFFNVRKTQIYDESNKNRPDRQTTVFVDLLNWLTTSRPNIIAEIAFLGCEHDYSGEQTHFYGKGTPDPLRYGSHWLVYHFRKFKAYAEQEGIVLRDLSGNTTGLLHRGMFDDQQRAGNPSVEGTC